MYEDIGDGRDDVGSFVGLTVGRSVGIAEGAKVTHIVSSQTAPRQSESILQALPRSQPGQPPPQSISLSSSSSTPFVHDVEEGTAVGERVGGVVG